MAMQGCCLSNYVPYSVDTVLVAKLLGNTLSGMQHLKGHFSLFSTLSCVWSIEVLVALWYQKAVFGSLEIIFSYFTKIKRSRKSTNSFVKLLKRLIYRIPDVYILK